MLRWTSDAYWFVKQTDYKVARLGVMTHIEPLINVELVRGEDSSIV